MTLRTKVENKIFKDKLAKLMATENLTVEYGEFETAVFNTVDRVLSLPNWSHTSNDVHNLLVGHEVSHALNTPQLSDESVFTDIDEDRPQVVHTYMNVVEDARIEREIKTKFPGLKRSFFNGYKTLVEEDKFGINDRDISEMNLIDRINLFFKVGNHVHVPFSPEEKPFLKLVENTNSFDDVMEVVKSIYSYAKTKAEDEMNEAETSTEHKMMIAGDGDDDSTPESNPASSDITDSEKVEMPSNSSSGEDEADLGDDQNSSDSDDTSGSGGNEGADDQLTDKLDSETSNSLKDSLDDLVEKDNWGSADVPNYYYIPEVNSDDFVVELKDVHHQIEAYYSNGYQFEADEIRQEFTKFKRDTSKVVNYMAKEFELKKNAEQMSRASVSKTGVIDVNKLHSYKYNDDLFRRVTSIPGGKNHGLVMFVDWSGSMSDSIGAVIRQSLTLAMFCKKVDIPFNLYSFTDAGIKVAHIIPGVHEPDDVVGNETHYGHPAINYKSGDMTISNFRLRELLNSKLNNRLFDIAMYNLFTMAKNLDDSYWRNVPYNDQLNSTPLNEAIIIAHDLIPKFRSHYNLEKVTAVWLTDGDSNSNDTRYFAGDGDNPYTYSSTERIVSNRTTKLQYPASNRSEMTNALLESLKETIQIETVGFFLTERRAQNLRYKIPMTEENEKKLKSFYRNKSAVFTNVRGYSEYYVLRSGKKDLDTDSDTFDIESGMKKGKITTAFKKHTKARLTNRVVLTSLIDVIS
tara:strand:+ start:352 stop:2583 length:2232 start_codon:yes stop_codon:yes gene_type:complete